MSSAGKTVRVEVVRILEAGECPLGHEVGNVWEVCDGRVPDGMCSSAWNAIQPFVTSLRYGGEFPWSGERELEVCCPDAANPVVFHASLTGEE